MPECIATVIVPTTGDRGLILPFSIGSILRQSIRNIEVFVIGDGVSQDTREVIHQLQNQDERIRFFDHPKDESRGEIYRHEALKEARGKIIAYLCDRDLMLPDHLATLYQQLQKYDIVATAHYKVLRSQKILIGMQIVPFGPLGEPDTPQKKLGAFKLSSVGHSLKAYKELPYGWRKTPVGQFTDRYMWRQFLAQPGIQMLNYHVPTFLYFNRGRHPGMPTTERKVELVAWNKVILDLEAWETAANQAMINTLNQRMIYDSRYKNWLLIRGQTPWDYFRAIPQKLANRLRRIKERPR